MERTGKPCGSPPSRTVSVRPSDVVTECMAAILRVSRLRLSRVRLLLLGSIVAEDLDDYSEIVLGGKVGDPEAAKRAAENRVTAFRCLLGKRVVVIRGCNC